MPVETSWSRDSLEMITVVYVVRKFPAADEI
jgi:hypothetical protein